jgi:hypothetical protein
LTGAIAALPPAIINVNINVKANFNIKSTAIEAIERFTGAIPCSCPPKSFVPATLAPPKASGQTSRDRS